MNTSAPAHVPYSGSTKQFIEGMNMGEERTAQSLKQALAVVHPARAYGWKLSRTHHQNGTFSIRRVR